MTEKLVRINKYLSEIGFCSRRQADKLIKEERVYINGELAVLGSKLMNNDKITIDGESISFNKKKRIYIVFNKPKGIVCTTDNKREKNNIIDYINYPERIFPIGRLDKLSEGLIFLTNDGDIVNKILRSRNAHEKEYNETVDKIITSGFLNKMRNGVPILGRVTKKCDVNKISRNSFKIILTQGLNRQIRRMCEHLGYKVKKLKRVRIMNVKLDIKPGEYRDFTEAELQEINSLLKKSHKTIRGNF